MTLATYRVADPFALDPAVEWLLSRITDVEITEGECRVSVDSQPLVSPSPTGLESALGNYLYQTFHAGAASQKDQEFIPALMEDNDIEVLLADATAARRRTVELAVVDRAPGDLGIVVSLNGVRVLIDPSHVKEDRGTFADVELPSVEPRLSLGFMFYTSTAGGGHGARVLRLYRHLANVDEAVDTWGRFTRWVEQNHVPLRAKVSSRRVGLPRHDALVVYLPAQSWDWLDEIVNVLSSTRPGAPTSIFAQTLAGGVGASWEPADPQRPRGDVSFGEHRTGAIARGVVRSERGADVRRSVRRELLAVNIDPTAVYRNLDSPLLPL